MVFLKKIVSLSMEDMQKMDGIVMIRGLLCRYMERMEMLKDIIFSGENF